MNEEEQMSQIYKKIEREKALLNAANSMLQQTGNEDVRSRINSQIRDARRNISFFEDKLRDLQVKRLGQGVDNMSLSSGSTAVGSLRPKSGSDLLNDSEGPPTPPPKDSSGGYTGQSGDRGSYGSAQYSQVGGHGDLMPPRHPYAPLDLAQLDLIKYDTQYLGPRIQLMLSQIQFKLNVEEQYLKGIEKMVQLYGMDGDRKSKADAAAKRVESKQKIQLLKQALKRYEELHIDDFESGDSPDDDSINMPNLRKPLTGQLSFRVIQVRDVDHASTARFSRGPETFVAVKVEDNIVARTKVARNDRWEGEYHNIEVREANEMELTVYDKPGEHALPIGMLWVRISDIIEEMRRKRIEAEVNNSGWVSANQIGNAGAPPAQFPMTPQQPQFSPPPGSPGFQSPPQQTSFGAQATPQIANQPIDAWFALEPSGGIHLQLNFTKMNKDRRPVDLGLGRKGAVRQRKEEVHEMYGHKFVQHQFYNIMRCALCGDFLKYSAGMQCEDCKYTCHTKCYSSVVTKCISKSNAETDPDEEKINHRIPHRFTPFSNVTANWCCHCGYMLPFGKEELSKVFSVLFWLTAEANPHTECNLTAHAACVHLVPDFCGMSMAVANQILEGIRTQKQRQSKVSSLSDKNPATGENEPVKRRSDLSIWCSPSIASQASQDATNAAKAMYGQTSPQRPMHPERTSTGGSMAAAAAASAAMSGTMASQGARTSGSQYSDPSAGRTGTYSSGPVDPYEDPYAQSQGYGAPQQPKYNPQAYANVDNYASQPQMQQPQQTHPIQQQLPPQQTQQPMYQQSAPLNL
ncbi:calcium-independent protein kinase C [Apiospora phragmitis]|uniref:Calcium-independent protein kinase C n=1 Tax=Apiospora phragmitis TaxID=2905665 RepID=A0ABR1X5K9_9PEZI